MIPTLTLTSNKRDVINYKRGCWLTSDIHVQQRILPNWLVSTVYSRKDIIHKFMDVMWHVMRHDMDMVMVMVMVMAMGHDSHGMVMDNGRHWHCHWTWTWSWTLIVIAFLWARHGHEYGGVFLMIKANLPSPKAKARKPKAEEIWAVQTSIMQPLSAIELALPKRHTSPSSKTPSTSSVSLTHTVIDEDFDLPDRGCFNGNKVYKLTDRSK